MKQKSEYFKKWNIVRIETRVWSVTRKIEIFHTQNYFRLKKGIWFDVKIFLPEMSKNILLIYVVIPTLKSHSFWESDSTLMTNFLLKIKGDRSTYRTVHTDRNTSEVQLINVLFSGSNIVRFFKNSI